MHCLRRGSEAWEALDIIDNVNFKKNNSNRAIFFHSGNLLLLSDLRERISVSFPASMSSSHQTLHITFICPCLFPLFCGTVDSAV